MRNLVPKEFGEFYRTGDKLLKESGLSPKPKELKWEWPKYPKGKRPKKNHYKRMINKARKSCDRR